MEVKQEVFAQLDALMRPGAILATNTSRLDVNEIAGSRREPAEYVWPAFFSPANVMRLLEVVRARRHSPGRWPRPWSVARRIGKLPVLVGVCDGFVGNRMVAQVRPRGASSCSRRAPRPRRWTAPCRRFGLAMGRFAMSRPGGQRHRLGQTASAPRPRAARSTCATERGRRLCELGRFGQKTGARLLPLREPAAARRCPTRWCMS